MNVIQQKASSALLPFRLLLYASKFSVLECYFASICLGFFYHNESIILIKMGKCFPFFINKCEEQSVCCFF